MAAGAKAQSTTFTGGLKAPTKVILSPGGNLIVAETGTAMMDGRISLIELTGARRTLIDGLPSAINLGGLFT
jgi:DNA-binding beta-propeller fold protein YncE